MGDFNFKYNLNIDNKEFTSIITTNGFRQIVKELTRVTDTSPSLIDLVFTNSPVKIIYTYVIISSLSEHNIIGTMRKVNHLKYPSRTIKCRNYAKYDHQKYRNYVSEIDWSLVYFSNYVDVAVSHFNSKLHKPIGDHAPFIEKRVKGRESKWLDAEIESEINSRDKLHRKAQKSKKEKDWPTYKKQCKKCNNLIKKSKASYHRNLIEENAANSKKFWNCIKGLFPSNSCRVQFYTILNLNSTIKTFSNYFSGAVKKLKLLTYPLENFTLRHSQDVRKSILHFITYLEYLY